MATSSLLSFSTTLPIPFSSSKPKHGAQNHQYFSSSSSSRKKQIVLASGGDMLGDFGARDPFPAEIETNFSDKVGNFGTEHKILIPNLSLLSLSQQNCTPPSPGQLPMSSFDAQKLIRKVVGWRVVDGEGGRLKLQCLWKLRDYKCGVELINRIYRVAEEAGHYPSLHLEEPNHVKAEIWTSSIGGLCMNDFILAAKIDEIKTSDLVPKKRVWA